MTGKNNLFIWDKFKTPPATALKEIRGGRLSGKSDINPQWRYKAMTEVFGVCGIGWKYEIVRLWTESGTEGQVFAFAQINLYTKSSLSVEEWSPPIPATGGSMLIELESRGLYCNDEAFKMAITDALGTAMKMLGIAADVYLGLFNGKHSKPIADGNVPRQAMGSPKSREESSISAPPASSPLPGEAKIQFTELLEKINAAQAIPHLKNIWLKYQEEIKSLSVKEKESLKLAKESQKSFLVDCTKDPSTCGKDLRDDKGKVGCELTHMDCEYIPIKEK